jgi:thiol:disulfide interchange protein
MGRSDSHSFSSEFTRGIFATVLATPCSGPLLGAVLAWTLTQPPFVIYAVFTAIGAGMASPYILLSSSRRVAKIIPKPGQWMNDFKHVMGFLLIGFAVYLMSGLTREMILVTTMLCLGLIFAAGIYGRFAPFGASFARRFWVAVFAVAVCVSIGYSGFSLFALKTGEEKWEPFSQDLLMRAHDDGRPVLANFTAQWCMNCQYNKHHTLNSKEVQKLATEKDILLMEVDLTNNSPVAEGLLHHLGSRSVPFLALFPGNDPYHPIIMRDIIGKRQLLDVLEKLD